MKILTGDRISALDKATAIAEDIDSWGLMERASEAIAQWIAANIESEKPLLFFIGKGNNGGDGLAVARMLANAGFECLAVIPFDENEMSADCLKNFNLLPENITLFCKGDNNYEPLLHHEIVIIDALLGTGCNGECREPIESLIKAINSSSNRVISLDVPSGMKCEFQNTPDQIVQASQTLTLGFPKLAMLLPEAGERCGELIVIPIELDFEFTDNEPDRYYYLSQDFVSKKLIPRPKFGHKGTFGHALIISGSEGMMGAALLATTAALRSGCGLVTLHAPREERHSVQTLAPSALLSLDPAECFSQQPTELKQHNAIGIGCGLGTHDKTKLALLLLLKEYRKPMVFDADALNIIAEHPEFQSLIPFDSVLTPHLGELRKMVGEWNDEEHKLELVRALAATTESTIVVKGAHTMVCRPDGVCFFNSTGGAGMAKGGSGDILTGLTTGLISRGYTPFIAAILSVWLHGCAGEKCAEYYGVEAMNSGDMVDFIAEAFNELIR